MDSTRVVVVSDDPKYRTSLKQVFRQRGYVIAGEADNQTATLRVLQNREPDVIVIDGDSVDFTVMDIFDTIQGDKLGAVVVILSLLHSHIVEKAKQSYFFSYVLKPVSDEALISALEIAVINFRRFMQMEQEIERLKFSLETRKLVAKAKGILMKEMSLTEEAAFKTIQRRSMDRGVSMKEVAQAIILTFE